MKIRAALAGGGEFLSTTAYADSDIVYSFDGDWGNDPYWGDFAPYDYFSRYDRDRATLSQDLRWQGPAGDAIEWVAGVYALRLTEDSLQHDYFAQELLREPLRSEYEATHLAVYGEAEWQVAASLAADRRLARRKSFGRV